MQIKRVLKKRLFSIVIGIVAVFMAWRLYLLVQRPFRQPTQQTLFQGVTYQREVWTEPRPIIFHIIEIDRTVSGVEFFVTPGDDLEGTNDYLAQKTTDFLAEHQLQLAINGDFFKPFEARTPFDYYPHVGDPVDTIGFAISDGVTYSTPIRAQPVFCVLEETAVSSVTAVIEKFICPPNTLHAIGGNPIFFENGETVTSRLNDAYLTEPQPRTMIALDDTGKTVWFIVVDGRQPRYSEGIGLMEMAPILTELGATISLNLDGGGSVTLAIAQNGAPKLLNSPIQTGIPLRERPIGNHIGIYAPPLD